MECDLDATVGSQLNVLINVPGLSGDKYVWVPARVEVVHVIFSGSLQAYKIGMKFEDFKDNGREVYDEFLAEHSRRYAFR